MIPWLVLHLVFGTIATVAHESNLNGQEDYDYLDPKDVFFDLYRIPRAKVDSEIPYPGGFRIKENVVKDKESRRMKRESQRVVDREPMSDREPRVTREQWVKQPYPVVRSDLNSTVPRVHFVTRRWRTDDRQMPMPPPPPFPYDRVDDRKGFWDSREVYRPRYDPYSYPRYDEPYVNRYDRGLRPAPIAPSAPPPPTARQGRIIYYATLPEVVRVPQDSHPYMNRPPDVHRYRTNFQEDDRDDKHRSARDQERYQNKHTKTRLYPVKVSTNMNVRNPNKTPETRIYSQVENRHSSNEANLNRAPENNFKYPDRY